MIWKYWYVYVYRSVEASLYNKANELQEDISLKRFDLRVAQIHLAAVKAQVSLAGITQFTSFWCRAREGQNTNLYIPTCLAGRARARSIRRLYNLEESRELVTGALFVPGLPGGTLLVNSACECVAAQPGGCNQNAPLLQWIILCVVRGKRINWALICLGTSAFDNHTPHSSRATVKLD